MLKIIKHEFIKTRASLLALLITAAALYALSLLGGAVITKSCVRFFARNARVQYQHSGNAKPCIPAVFIFTHRRRTH